MIKKYLSILATISLFSACQQSPQHLPKPTETKLHQGDEEGNANARQEWFELMHRTAPGTSWQQLEYETAMERHQLKQSTAQLHSDEETLADGQLIGQWHERGSKNQAGSVYETIYDPATDQIYTVSAGGTLWVGGRDGSNWQVVNQDLRFSRWFLEFVTLPNGEQRMLALINKVPHYSDDEGATWQLAGGNITSNDFWGGVRHAKVLNNGNILAISKAGYWEDYSIYLSQNHGQSFEVLQNLNNNESGRYALAKSPNGSDVYFIEKLSGSEARLSIWNATNNNFVELITSNEIDFEGQPANLTVYQSDTETKLFFYGGSGEAHVKESTDNGMNWTYKGNIPEMPWAVGMFVSPSNPDVLMAGGLHCYKSLDAGTNWILQNDWWEYYDDVNGSIHADIMTFREYETADGTTFQLISNHGGLSVSYDNLNTLQNIGLQGLNVNQFYDVRTDPVDPLNIYAGSQDQGFQRGVSFPFDEPINMEQVISGDYGHIAFSDQGRRLWAVYPGGGIYYYNYPQTGYNTAYYELNSENETVWIPPLMESPDQNTNEVYLAGGNANGGSGSYIIKLEQNAGNITATNLPFNFLSNAGGEVSAISHSNVDSTHWYVGTTNGRFFYSIDYGQNWEQSLNFVPSGHYLYGQTILPSKLNENTVYYGGSGYGNPAVYISTDNGASFQAMNNGLPSTLVFELASNADESMLFAATEAGPYVFVVADNQWYPMHGEAAPNQTFWSVEFVESQDLVRFGTFGRGIWDFKIEEIVSTTNTADKNLSLKIYPNPATDFLQIEIPEVFDTNIQVKIFNSTGQLMKQSTLTNNTDILEMNIQDLNTGFYFLEISDKNQKISEQFLVK